MRILVFGILFAFSCSSPPASTTPASTTPALAAAEPVGELVPRADDELANPKNPRCKDALANIEAVFGADFEAALKRGVFPGYNPFTRVQFYESCTRWSIRTRQCAILSRSPEQIAECSPVQEPWIRESYAGLPEDEVKAYNECLVAAKKRSDLDVCLTEARARTRR